MKTKQKLELTWIGKDDEYKDIEPRILVEVPEKSYGDKNTENMLIHGDNLLALKALEQDYTCKIKCTYIDPPYNTGSRINADGDEVGYDDGFEHSAWLNLMKPRLEILKNLLSHDGTLAVQIDDNEYARLYLLLIEIFGQKNLKTICVKMSEATGVKMAHVINNGRIPKLKEYIIIARKEGIKDLWCEKIPKEKWDDEYKHLITGVSREEILKLKDIISNDSRCSETDIEEADNICAKFQLKPVEELFENATNLNNEEKNSIKYENAWRIVRDVATSDGAKKIADQKKNSVIGNCFMIKTTKNKKYIIKKDYNENSSQPRIKLLFADDYLTVHPGDFWQDIKTTGLDNEGGIDFKKGKKPEALIKRIVGMASKEGDYVLDSFAGSGTTGCVAHKMKRKWIMIEMANHCYSHIIPRIRSVIEGTDTQGITSSVNWKGGGGYKFYELAPSLLRKDEFDNWIIEPKYDAEMLAEAMAKHEGYKFSPDENNVYKQGYSTEKDFIFTTTQFLSNELLNQIHNKLEESESLLICATHFEEGVGSAYSNITVKKIPQMLLNRCEFGRAEYNLNIIEEAQPEDVEEDFEEE